MSIFIDRINRFYKDLANGVGEKNRIIRRFLKEISENPVSMELQDIDMSHYSDLDKLLEHIDLHKNNLFDWETFETDPEQWREFCAIIKFSTVFEKGGSPPLLKSVDFIKAEEGIRYTLNAHEIIQLPRDNYYERPTRTLQDVDTELEELIVNSRAKLYALTQTFADLIPFNAADSLQVLTQIQFLDEEMEKLPQNNSAREIIEKS